jgi:hypothetical protein
MASNLPASHAKQVADFLQKVKTARGRIAFVIDATMSREQTWDAAAQLQAEMFSEAAKLGGLEMQVTYFRGVDEVKSSNWTSDARELQHFMGRVRCEAGYTKYAQAFAQVRKEHGQQAISAMVVVGDMLEEEPRTLYDAVAGLGVPCFCFSGGQRFPAARSPPVARSLQGGGPPDQRCLLCLRFQFRHPIARALARCCRLCRWRADGAGGSAHRQCAQAAGAAQMKMDLKLRSISS